MLITFEYKLSKRNNDFLEEMCNVWIQNSVFNARYSSVNALFVTMKLNRTQIKITIIIIN